MQALHVCGLMQERLRFSQVWAYWKLLHAIRIDTKAATSTDFHLLPASTGHTNWTYNSKKTITTGAMSRCQHASAQSKRYKQRCIGRVQRSP
jgi:hypothetical protein